MYTLEELQKMGNIISSVNDFMEGLIIRKVGFTFNYYSLNNDGTWDNYDCRTSI